MQQTATVHSVGANMSLTRRALAVLMAIVLAVGLMPHVAWADGSGDASTADTFSVALTIIDSTDSDNGILKNVKVDNMTSDDTVADLLEEVGFLTGDQAASEADYTVYFESNGSPYFKGKGYDSTTGYYWATMYNGDSANYDSAMLTSKLQANGHYEYIYTDATTFDYASDDGTFPVQLTIVDTTDSKNGTLANVKVTGMTVDDKVSDLLKKAGFDKVDSAAATEGNDKAYADSYDSPVFRGNKTLANDDGTWTYWCTMFDGDSANYASAQLQAYLQAGGHYQYIYTNGSTYSYAWPVSNLVCLSSVTDPLAQADPEPEPTPDSATTANAYNADNADTLLKNLKARFAKSGADASISNNTYAAAIALNSLGLGATVDSASILSNMNKQAGEMTAGRMGKFIMALTAAGVDCTAVDDNGTTRNLVSEMEAMEESGSVSVYDAVCILPVYQYGSYQQTSGKTEAELASIIVSSADSEGLFGNAQYGCDTQTTAQGILALLPYRSGNAEANAAITKAAAALLSYENADGSFGYSASYKDANLDATATVVCALEALGYDAAAGKDLTAENGSTPLGYLVASADRTLDGYEDASAYDEPQTSAAVLMALSAHDGAQQSGKAYSVYTLQFADRVFPDVDYDDPNCWYVNGVNFCYSKGLITGYAAGEDAGKFGVGKSMTAAEFAVMLWRNADPEAAAAYDEQVQAATVNKTDMSDVADGQWYTAAVNWAVANDVLHGYDDVDGRHFRPDEAISFERMVTIMGNLCSKGANQTADPSLLAAFTDGNAVSDWAQGSIAWGKSVGLVNGYENEDGTRTLRPQEQVSRERAAVVLMNAFKGGVLTSAEAATQSASTAA